MALRVDAKVFSRCVGPFQQLCSERLAANAVLLKWNRFGEPKWVGWEMHARFVLFSPLPGWFAEHLVASSQINIHSLTKRHFVPLLL